MKIVFEPSKSKSNAYVNILTESLEKSGVQSCSVQSVFADLSLFRDIKVVHLNWYENTGSILQFIKQLTKLLIFIAAGKKIIWTFHNKKPHNQAYQSLSRLIMYLLARSSESIIIHSRISENLLAEYYDESIRRKVKYIPHPNYINVYGEKQPVRQAAIPGPLSLIFLGAVKPYKNIELLMDAVQTFTKEDVELTIMGKPVSQEYKLLLEERAAGSDNIHLNLQFVDDSSISSLLSAYDLMVLPYSVESSLNSGSTILAFSYGKTVICPMIGTIADFDSDVNIMSYDYHDNKDHLLKLREVIRQSIILKKENANVFSEMGEAMFEKVKKANDIETVTKRFLEVYQR